MSKQTESIGQRVRRLRQAAGMSQQELAVAADLSMSLIAQLEQDKRDDPRLSTVVALARALGVGLIDLVGYPMHFGDKGTRQGS